MVVKGVREIFSFSEDNTFVQSAAEERKQKNLPGKNERSVVGGCPVCRNNRGKTRVAVVEGA